MVKSSKAGGRKSTPEKPVSAFSVYKSSAHGHVSAVVLKIVKHFACANFVLFVAGFSGRVRFKPANGCENKCCLVWIYETNFESHIISFPTFFSEEKKEAEKKYWFVAYLLKYPLMTAIRLLLFFGINRPASSVNSINSLNKWVGFEPYCPTAHCGMYALQSSINTSNMSLLLGASPW